MSEDNENAHDIDTNEKNDVDIEQYVKEREESIRKGARRSPTRFRL